MAAIPAHELTLSRDCATAGCQGEAEASGLCRVCERGSVNGKPRIRFEATGLVVEGELSDDELRSILRQLARMDSAIGWALGDALVQAEARWRTTWKDVLQDLGIAPWTASTYRWIAASVPLERRRPGLPFSLYREIAALPAAEQEEWLDRAEREGMTVGALQAAVKGARLVKAGKAEAPPDLEQVNLRVTAAADAVARWRKAADERGVSLSVLAAEALDQLVGAPALEASSGG